MIAPQLQGYGVRSSGQTTDGAFEGDIFNLFRRGCTVKWVGSAGAPLLHNLQGNSYVGGQWAAGDAPMFYVMSPKDVVIAKPRMAERLSFLWSFSLKSETDITSRRGEERPTRRMGDFGWYPSLQSFL
ncbi:hypothetical protein MKW98_004061, partial [Papaver atlanticum]